MMLLDGSNLTPSAVISIMKGEIDIGLAESSRSRVDEAREAVEKIVKSGQPAYGINTGFGDLVSVAIPAEDLSTLQENLVRSHACGIGESMNPLHVIGMMTVRLNSLLVGNSGIK